MNNPFLVGNRVYLRPVEPEDARILAECNNDPAVRVSFFTHTPTSLFHQANRAEEFYRAGADYIPLIICTVDEDEAIGVTAFHRVDLVSHAAIYSVCICDSGHWRKGFGGEVTRLMLHYAFDILNLHRVQLHVWSDNAAGISIYRRAGFVEEGRLREAMRHDGRYFDFLVMGILDHEWRAAGEERKTGKTDGAGGPDPTP